MLYPPSIFDSAYLCEDSFLAPAAVCHSLCDPPAHLAGRCLILTHIAAPRFILLSQSLKGSTYQCGMVIIRPTNRPKPVPLIFDKLKSCENTFLLWFCFVLYRSAWSRVSLFVLSAASLLFSFSFDFSCCSSVEEFNHFLLCPPWCWSQIHSSS